MGLNSRTVCLLVLLQSSLIFAAPKLRLDRSTVGPVTVNTGAAGPAQTVEAFNVGDGSLSLQAVSSVPWLTVSVGSARPCAVSSSCTPINIALQTATLARGLHTGLVTVRDPNALDAPQTITVTVQAGSAVPDRADFIVAPNGGTQSLRFTTATEARPSATTQDGRPWLTVAADGVGTFRFSVPYRITARSQQGQAEGTYNGSVVTSGSTLAADNKTIPVTMRVTSGPIARASSERLEFRGAQNGPRLQAPLVISNGGLGTFTVTGATATSTGGDWLKVETNPQAPAFATVSVTPGTLAPGTYQGTVTINSNAANAALAVPVTLTVVAAGLPYVYFEGAQNNATFRPGDPLAPNGIVALKGEQLSANEPALASSLPLGTELSGVRVLVNGQPAPIFYTSFNQINFILPPTTQPGEAVIRVERNGQLGNSITAQIVPLAPRILRLGIDNYGIIVNQDGTFPIVPTPGIPARAAKPGDALVIYALGLGATSPAVTTGAASPANPLASTTNRYQVSFGGGTFGGGVVATPFFAGLTPGLVGLYQINVIVPEDAPKGPAIPLLISSDDGVSSNIVTIAIE